MTKLFHLSLRFLVGILLIAFAFKNISNIKAGESFVTQSIDRIQTKYLSRSYNISFLKDHSYNILYAQFFCLLTSSLSMMFGFSSTSSLFAFAAVLIELTLVHNPLFLRDPKYVFISSGYLGLFGAALNL